MKRYWLIEKRSYLTQEQLASEVGMSRSAYSNIESGHRDPSVAVARKIADRLQFNWTMFFEYDTANSVPQDATM